MAKNNRSGGFDEMFAGLVDRLAEAVASRLSGRGAAGKPAAAKAKRGGRRANAGRKLDMSCRIEGCKNRSGGPRNGFMCEEHKKLPKKEQQAARDAWKAKHA